MNEWLDGYHFANSITSYINVTNWMLAFISVQLTVIIITMLVKKGR